MKNFLQLYQWVVYYKPKQQGICDHWMTLFEIVTVFACRWQWGFDTIKMEHIIKLNTEFN
jgi:hypothetical protein